MKESDSRCNMSNCWRALARQQPIPYNNVKKLKNFSDVRSETCAVDCVFYSRVLVMTSCKMYAEISIDFKLSPTSRRSFFLSAFNSSEVLGKDASIRSESSLLNSRKVLGALLLFHKSP